MELSKFDSPAAARDGKWFDVCLLDGRFVALTETERASDTAYRDAQPVGTAEKPVRLKLASLGTQEYEIALRSGFLAGAADGMNRAGRRRGKRGKTAGTLPSAEQQIRAENEALAEQIILDWTGIEKDGVAIPCTLEHKLDALELDYFRKMVIEAAQDFADLAEAELGNSERTPENSSG